MRTRDEILEKIKASSGFLDFTASALVMFLDYEDALPFCDIKPTAEEWAREQVPLTDSTVRREIANYMTFAWEKVEDHRGISAGRSVDKMTAWLWLLGDDATLAAVEAAGYAQYGAPKLAVICEAYGLPIPDRVEVQRMIRGERCGADYECGCGR